MSNFKKYYWLKLFDNFFDDPKVKKLKRLAGGDTYIVILLRLMLLTIKNNGVYIYQGLENSLAKELELILDEPEEHIQAVLIYLEKTDMIKEVSKNNFLLVDVPMMLGSETTTAERMRKSRAKKKQLNCNNVTPLLQNVPNCYTEIEKEIDIEIDNLSPLPSLTKKQIDPEKEEREENKKSFLNFINDLRKKYKGNSVHSFYPVLTTYENQEIKVASNGYLYFGSTTEYLAPAQAQNVWEYLYKNPSAIIPISKQGAAS